MEAKLMNTMLADESIHFTQSGHYDLSAQGRVEEEKHSFVVAWGVFLFLFSSCCGGVFFLVFFLPFCLFLEVGAASREEKEASIFRLLGFSSFVPDCVNIRDS